MATGEDRIIDERDLCIHCGETHAAHSVCRTLVNKVRREDLQVRRENMAQIKYGDEVRLRAKVVGIWRDQKRGGRRLLLQPLESIHAEDEFKLHEEDVGLVPTSYKPEQVEELRDALVPAGASISAQEFRNVLGVKLGEPSVAARELPVPMSTIAVLVDLLGLAWTGDGRITRT